MSNSRTSEKVTRRQKIANWFNARFKTRLEKDAEKLIAMFDETSKDAPKGKNGFRHSRTGIEKDIAFAEEMQLKGVSVNYWCEMTGATWKEFSSDSHFLSELHEELNKHTDRLVQDLGKLCSRRKGDLEKADDEKAALDIKKEFESECNLIITSCEVTSVEIINKAFNDKSKLLGGNKRYKFKAGAKLISTFVGIIVSAAALSTAATPAAPATLVPAIIGLVSSAASIGKQIADLLASAEEIEAEINANSKKIELNYKTPEGKPKKGIYRAREFATGFTSQVSGGLTDLAIPSIKALLDETGLHANKVDGLEVKLHDMGIAINAIVDSMGLAGKVLDDNLKKSEEAKNKREAGKLQKSLRKSLEGLEKVQQEFHQAFTVQIPGIIERVSHGREANKTFKSNLELIEQALGTKNFAVIGQLLGLITVTGIGYSSPPSEQIEKIMSSIVTGWTAIDTLRDFTPDIIDKAFGEPTH